jgi:hypothetical protein
MARTSTVEHKGDIKSEEDGARTDIVFTFQESLSEDGLSSVSVLCPLPNDNAPNVPLLSAGAANENKTPDTDDAGDGLSAPVQPMNLAKSKELGPATFPRSVSSAPEQQGPTLPAFSPTHEDSAMSGVSEGGQISAQAYCLPSTGDQGKWHLTTVTEAGDVGGRGSAPMDPDEPKKIGPAMSPKSLSSEPGQQQISHDDILFTPEGHIDRDVQQSPQTEEIPKANEPSPYTISPPESPSPSPHTQTPTFQDFLSEMTHMDCNRLESLVRLHVDLSSPSRRVSFPENDHLQHDRIYGCVRLVRCSTSRT